MKKDCDNKAYKQAFQKSRERLKKLQPIDICNTSLCEYDDNKGFFRLESFNNNFEISYPGGEVFFTDCNKMPPIDWSLILLNYLSSAKDIPTSEKWVSYRELPHGNVFFPSIKTHVLEVLSRFFSNTKDQVIKTKLDDLGFEIIDNRADIEAIGSFTPRVPIKIQFWYGEDAIPPSFQILFDKTAYLHMHIEDIAAICGVLRDLLIL